MAKYDPLRNHLSLDGSARITMSFEQIDRMVPGGLPPSAYKFQAWWAHENEPRQSQKCSWCAAGYTVDRYDLAAKTVTFRKR